MIEGKPFYVLLKTGIWIFASEAENNSFKHHEDYVISFSSPSEDTREEDLDNQILLDACRRANELMGTELERLKKENEKMKNAIEETFRYMNDARSVYAYITIENILSQINKGEPREAMGGIAAE